MEDNQKNKSIVKQAIPFFMVANMENALDFYINRLGFELKNKWEPRGKIEWCLLQRDGVSLMLQEPRNKEKSDQEQDVPNGKGVAICFQCSDALALYHEFSAKGIAMKEPFVGNNMWVINFSDPDGYKLDFESPTDVSEETIYSAWLESNKKL
jgi:lactoylglutathione lyase